MFIVIDGIAGSGKSTVIGAIKQKYTAEGKHIFDLADWCKQYGNLPTFEQVHDADLFFTFEPTKAWVGSAIREEMSSQINPYTGTELAQAFALDRLLLYRRLIIPALQAGKTIIQDRSVSSSLTYQPVMPDGPTLEALLALPGNALAMEYAPDHLILTDIDPALAVSRIKSRVDASKGVFEDLELLKKIHERFRSDWFKKLYEDRGTTMHMINTGIDMQTSLSLTMQLLQKISPQL